MFRSRAGTADTDFAPQLRDLADTMQVVSYDPRGYGQSRPPERDFPLDFYQRDADDAAALMAALGHDKYAVMGWSDGAISAVKLAAEHSPAVRPCSAEEPSHATCAHARTRVCVWWWWDAS